ncbi:MAG: hypothetical protein KKA55_12430 [Proteobacteria bacterium]|nr:hypothetical protein [Pseudomonadota bacterium]MBU1596325.1 hypothetical protein [Pseudomonadota bacterium]
MTARSQLALLILAAALGCAVLTPPAPALAVSDDPVLRRMDTVLEENARLREEAWKAHKSHDQSAARQAAEELAASEERVERTRAEALAHVANVSPGQVEALRKDGKSWGQTAGELGVHPGFLGIGKTPMYESLPKRKAKGAAAAVKKGKAARGKTAAKSEGKDKPAKVAAAKGKSQKASKGEARIKTKAKAPSKAKAKPEKKTRGNKK